MKAHVDDFGARCLFGAFAQEVGSLSREQLKIGLEQQQRFGGRLGQILRDQGFLSREQVPQVLDAQARWLARTLPAGGMLNPLPRPVFLSLCLPAFNEEENIADTVDAACAILPHFVEHFEVVVVNDGSRDRTGEIMDQYALGDPRVRVLHHRGGNRGYGAAVTTGLRSARGDLIAFADSDGQFSFLDAARFLEAIETCDVVVGYRQLRADAWNRNLNAWAWNKFIRVVLGVRIRDLDCAFKLFRRQVVERLELTATGACINAQIMSQCQRNRYKIREIPVAHFPRCHGAPTGANWRVIVRAFQELPRLWPYRVARGCRPRKATFAPPLYRNGKTNGLPPSNGGNGTILPRGVVASGNGHSVSPFAVQADGSILLPVRPVLPPIPGAKEPGLKICMLAACPFPANHGTPGSIREMAEAVAARGHEVHLVTYHFGEDIPVHGPYLHRIAPWTRESAVVVGPTRRRPLYDLQMVFKTLEVIRRHRPVLMHAHGYEAALIAGVCRLFTGLPVVYSGHNTMADELPSYRFIRPRWLAVGLARFLDAVVPRLANRCIPHSTNLARFFRGMGLAARTEPIIPFGINLPDAPALTTPALRQRFGLGDGPVVVYAGVMDEFQRLDLLLEAMKEVLWYEPRAQLLMIVTIPQEKHLAAIRARAETLGIAEHVILTGPQPLPAVQQILPACDVAVVPRPQAPGFPIKLLNYIVAGRPCVLFASSASGLEHGEHAFLVSPDTSAALGQGILELLRDEPLRARLSENAYQFVRQHHDASRTAQMVCAAYLRALAATGLYPRQILPQERVEARAPVRKEAVTTPVEASTHNRTPKAITGTYKAVAVEAALERNGAVTSTPRSNSCLAF